MCSDGQWFTNERSWISHCEAHLKDLETLPFQRDPLARLSLHLGFVSGVLATRAFLAPIECSRTSPGPSGGLISISKVTLQSRIVGKRPPAHTQGARKRSNRQRSWTTARTYTAGSPEPRQGPEESSIAPIRKGHANAKDGPVVGKSHAGAISL